MAVKKKNNKSYDNSSTVKKVDKELNAYSDSDLVDEDSELIQKEVLDEAEEAKMFKEAIEESEESELFEEEDDNIEETELFKEDSVEENDELDWFDDDLEEELENQSAEAGKQDDSKKQQEEVLSLAIRNTQSKINFDNVILANSKQHSRSFVNPGVITVIDGGKCGRRVAISKDLYVELGLVDMVQIAFEDESILMGKFINENANSYGFRTQGAKHIIYCASLVREITQRLELEFAKENKTSITFNSVEYDYTFDTPIAIIKRY